MKKKMVSVLLGVVMTASLVLGCGGNSASTEVVTEEAEATEDVAETAEAGTDDETLTVWCWDPNFNIYAMKEAEKAAAEAPAPEEKKAEEAPAPAPAEPAAPAPEGGAKVRGRTTVSVSPIQRPGFAMSGSVSFGSGVTADWYVDQTGRLGLDNASGQPDEQDIQEFQLELRKALGM